MVTTIWVLVNGAATEAIDCRCERSRAVSVMVLPAASAPPAVVVNENVAAAEVFLATRSAKANPTVTEVTSSLPDTNICYV